MKKAAVPSILVVVVLLAVAVPTEAQQPKKVHRIGYLSLTGIPNELRVDSFAPWGFAPAWVLRGEKHCH